MEFEKNQIDELMKIKEEYEKILAEKEKHRLDVLEREKLERIKADIIDELHGKKIVFSTPPENPEPNVEYKNFNAYLKMVKNNDIRLKAAMSTDSDAGYTVPKEFSKVILGALNNIATAPSKCSEVEMTAPTVDFPSWLTDITLYWSTQGRSKTTTKPTFSKLTLSLNFLYAIITMTKELLEDNIVDLSDKLETLVGENIGLELEKQILEGDGTPYTGVANATGVNNVSLGAGTLAYSDLVSVVNNNGQLERYKKKAEWWLTRNALTLIMSLTDQHGRPLWNMNTPLSTTLTPTILNYPYNISDQIADTTGSDGTTTIYFGDMETVLIGKKRGDNNIRVLSSETAIIDSSGTVSENAFTENKHMFRFEIRRGILITDPKAWVKLSNVK